MSVHILENAGVFEGLGWHSWGHRLGGLLLLLNWDRFEGLWWLNRNGGRVGFLGMGGVLLLRFHCVVRLELGRLHFLLPKWVDDLARDCVTIGAK